MFNLSCQSYEYPKDDEHLCITKRKKNDNNKNKNVIEKVKILYKTENNKELINNIDQIPLTEEDELQIIDYPYMNKRISENFFDFSKTFFPSEDTNLFPEASVKNCNSNQFFSRDIPNILENNVLNELNKNNKKSNENTKSNKNIDENENENDDTIKDQSTGVIVSPVCNNNFNDNLKNYILIKTPTDKNINYKNYSNYKNIQMKPSINIRKNSEVILIRSKNKKNTSKNKIKNANHSNLNEKSVKSQILKKSNEKINTAKKYNIRFNTNSKKHQNNNYHFFEQKKKKNYVLSKNIPMNYKNKISHLAEKNKNNKVKVHKKFSQNDVWKSKKNVSHISENKRLNLKNLIIKIPKNNKNDYNIHSENLDIKFRKEKYYTQNYNYINAHIKNKRQKQLSNFDNASNLKNNNSEDIYDFNKISKIRNKHIYKISNFLETTPNIRIHKDLNDLYLNTKVLFTKKTDNHNIRKKLKNTCSSRNAFKLKNNI